jgi:uncharacterized protein GlcG (DUF336 family)
MTELTLSVALTIAQGALDSARKGSYKPLTVVVLDVGGHPKVILREDGTGYYGISIATAKAATVLGFNLPSSRLLGERFDARPGLVAALSAITGGGLLPGPGGKHIRSGDGRLLGAIGVSGGAPDEDEAALDAGIASAGLSGS